MEFVRQVIDSNLLTGIDVINLPRSLVNKKVEIIILPLNNNDHIHDEEISIDDVAGCFSEYRNPDLIPLEKNAWAEAMEDKHGNS